MMNLGNLCWKRCTGQRNEIDSGSRGSFTLKQIKGATNNFDPGNKIGEGSFGLPVYKGLLSEGTAIAVKQLRFKSKQENLEHVKEIRKISTIQHPNLVKLYGCCIDGDRIFLVYEYLENNSLARALFGPDKSPLKVDWPTRRKICIGVAEALAFIHGESRLKVDRDDIKATNVLLDKDLNSKVSDFRLAKFDHKKYNDSTISYGGSFGYMEPKYNVGSCQTDEVGIYSFGVVALEIVSGISSSVHRPKEECLYLLDWARMLQEEGDLMDLVDPRLESNYIKDEVLVMIDVALLCTNAPRTLRPTMSSVVSMLKGETSVEEYVSST